MKPENQTNSNLAKTPEQARDQAIKDFMHPEDKIKQVNKKNFFVRNLGLTITAAALVVSAAGAAIYEGIKKSNEPVPVPEYFDPSALKSVIGENNLIQIPASEYFASAPSIWNEENHTMTANVPIFFHDGRTPTLDVEKWPDDADSSIISKILIKSGLEQGDVLFANFDGTIQVSQEHEDLALFFLDTEDSKGRGVSIMVTVPGGLDPLFNFDHNINGSISLDVTKNMKLGAIKNSSQHMVIIGMGPGIEEFNLATTQGKATILTEK